MKCINKSCKDHNEKYDDGCGGLGIQYDGHLCAKGIITEGTKKFNVEVAVAFTDHTWIEVSTEVEDFPEEMAAQVAEDKVLSDYADHPTKTVSFVKTIWIGESK